MIDLLSVWYIEMFEKTEFMNIAQFYFVRVQYLLI